MNVKKKKVNHGAMNQNLGGGNRKIQCVYGRMMIKMTNERACVLAIQ